MKSMLRGAFLMWRFPTLCRPSGSRHTRIKADGEQTADAEHQKFEEALEVLHSALGKSRTWPVIFNLSVGILSSGIEGLSTLSVHGSRTYCGE